MPKKKISQPLKPEIITMHAMKKLGLTTHRIGKTLGWDFHTVKKYLTKELSPEEQHQVRELVERIEETELLDLTLIGAKARAHLHKLLDEGNMKPIETIAAIDRSFQQRRLLQGKSSINLDIHSMIQQARIDMAQNKEQSEDSTFTI